MKKVIFMLVALISMLCLTFGVVCAADETEEQPVEENPVEEVENILKEYFSAEKVAMYMSWLAYIGTIIGLVVNINKLKKQGQFNLKDATKLLNDKVAEEVAANTEKFMPNLIKTQEATNNILKSFSKILALSQENTPESRVAILNIIEQLGTTGKEVIDGAKAAIEQETQLIQEHKEEVENKLNEIIEQYDGTSI